MSLSKHAKEIHRKAIILSWNSVEPIRQPERRLLKKTIAEMKALLKQAEKALR